MVIQEQIIIKLLLAILVGGAIGLERELQHKAAGFRTIILICVGATLFTILDGVANASGRISANIVTGVGFLGAGVILHEASRVRGLTTSAGVWLSAALGMGIGLGEYAMTLIAAVLLLVVMRIFARLEIRFDQLWELRTYEIDIPCRIEKVAELETELKESGLKAASISQMKRDGNLTLTCVVTGPTHKQQDFVQRMLADAEVTRIEW